MPTYRSTPQFEHGLPESTGVLVVNLGTPESPAPGAVRKFLREFLSDPRVVEYPRLIWWLILNLVILTIRPSRSAAAYRKIWTEQGSPLMIHSRAIVAKLAKRLAASGPIRVELAMTYGEPSIASAIDKLLASGARQILTLPLYPQYSGTTTAAVFDRVVRGLAQYRWVPESRFINSFHDAPGYIDALAASVRESWNEHGRGDKLLMSFHGVPKSTLLNGDPYHCHCQKTARLLANALELADTEWVISFQSRVGREEWLTPYTETTVKGLGRQGLAPARRRLPGVLDRLPGNAGGNCDAERRVLSRSRRWVPALHSVTQCS